MLNWNKRLLRRAATAGLATLVAAGLAGLARADSVYQAPPFSQSWPDPAQIQVDHNWSGVPGILGYATGPSAGVAEGADPQTVTADLASSGPLYIKANQSGPGGNTIDPIAEFESHSSVDNNRVVGLRPQTAYPAPHLLVHVNTTGIPTVRVQYTLRDIDTSARNAVQAVALQYRVGASGPFTNVPEAYVADATVPNAATSRVVQATLPAAAGNRAQLQLRIITTNAVDGDEWVGIDDLSVTATAAPGDLSRKLYLPSVRR